MAAILSDDLYAKVATIDNASGDLASYIDSLGDMFLEVESLARANDRSKDNIFANGDFHHGLDGVNAGGSIGSSLAIADPSGMKSRHAVSFIRNNAGLHGGINFYAHPGELEGTWTYAWEVEVIAPAGEAMFVGHDDYSDDLTTWIGWTQTNFTGTGAPQIVKGTTTLTPGTRSIDFGVYADQPQAFATIKVGSIRFYPANRKELVPWAKPLDPDEANSEAMLLWLAQLAGVKVPVGLDAQKMRSLIKLAEGRRRGTIAYMVEVAQRLLTGTKTVYTHERVSSAYTLAIATKATETPDSAAVLKALLAVKPAGIVLTFATTTGVIWDVPTHGWDAAAAVTWDASLSTVP